ncbi:MAG TPA: uracil-DNA glycosylase [Longimicrobiales bacterium]
MPRKLVKPPCWSGTDSTEPFVAGVPEILPTFRSIGGLMKAMACCTRCELATTRTKVVMGVGNAAARLMLIGEAPGEKEDLAGRPFVGGAGRLLDKILETSGILRDDVFITNIVACRPPRNRTPRVTEVKAHAPWMEQQLRLVDPVLVVTLGRVALTYFIPKAKVTELRGKPQKVRHSDRLLTILPTFHPAAVLRDPERRPKLEADFRKVTKLLAALGG